MFDERARQCVRHRYVAERATRQEIARERAVRADGGQIELEFAYQPRRRFGAASGDQHDAHAQIQRGPNRLPVCRSNPIAFVEQRTVEVEGDQIDPWGLAGTHHLEHTRAVNAAIGLEAGRGCDVSLKRTFVH